MARGPYGETHDGSDVDPVQVAKILQLEDEIDERLASFYPRDGESFMHVIPEWIELTPSMRRMLTNRYAQAGWKVAELQRDISSEYLHLRLF